MTGWVRFDNTMPDNIKVAPLNDRSFRLWINAICYCSRAQSDGFLPLAVLPALCRTAALRAARDLVGAKLFDEVEGGFRVHDYLDFNPSRARLTEMRESSKRSTARWRDGNVTGHKNGSDASVTRHSHGRDRSVPTPIRLLCQRLAEQIVSNDARANPKPESDRWLTDMRLLVEDRHGDVAEVQRVIDWCQADPFWRSNILSPGKLRKQFTQLVLRASSAEVVQLRRPNASDLLRKLDEAELGA